MKQILITTIAFLIALSVASQTNNCIELIKVKKIESTNPNVKDILSPGTKWKVSAYYYLLKDSLDINSKNEMMEVIDNSTIKWHSPDNKLIFKSKTKFKVIYGGKGPEQQTFVLKYYDGQCLLLESTFVNKGYANGKLIYREKKSVRYLLNKQ